MTRRHKGVYNLIDCFLAKIATIGGVNTVKIAISHGLMDFSVFRGISTCELKQIVKPNDIDQLSEHYLVWYKPNEYGLSGWNFVGSINYRLREYWNALVNNSIAIQPQVLSLAQSFKTGLKQPVEILVAFDISHNISLIVDGTKRVLALYYLKQKEPAILNKLISLQKPIHVLQLNSAYCGLLFPCDFLKLYLKTQEN